MEQLINKIKNCKTLPKLDELRMECVTVGKGDKDTFLTIQKAFVKKKNQLKSIPLFERNW